MNNNTIVLSYEDINRKLTNDITYYSSIGFDVLTYKFKQYQEFINSQQEELNRFKEHSSAKDI